MEKILALYEYVDGVNDTSFPNSDEQVFIGSFTYNAVRMGGAPSITATVKHSLCLDNLWSRDVYAEFNGEKYFVVNTPSSSKSNDDSRYEHSVELLSERDVLNHVYFIDAVQKDSSIDKYKSNSTNILFVGDIHEFAGRIADAIAYSGLDYTVVVDNGIASEEKTVSFEDKKILEALQEIYNIFEIPYYFVGKTIHIGYTENAIPNVMKYGDSEALLSVSKENANYEAINRITGTGSSDNIPYYYPNTTPDGDISIEVNPSSTGISAGDVIITNGLALSEVSSSDDFTYMECKTEIPDSDGNAESQCRVTASRFYVYAKSLADMEKVAESTTGLLTVLPMRMEHPSGGYVSFASNRLEIDVKVDKPCTIHWQPDLQKTVTVSGQTLTNRTTRYYYRTQSGTQYNINNYTFNVGQSAIGTITLCCEIAYATQYATADAIEYDYTLLLTHALDYQGNGWTLDGENSVFLSDYGLTLKQGVSPNEGDSFHKLIIRTNPIVQNLMPSIYRESDGAERFYNAKNNTYKDEGGDYYEFENEYSVNNIREGITDFPDIMPTITGIVNASGQRIDRFVAFAYDANDNNELNEEGEYIHPFFFAKLRKMDGDNGFNLFDHAIEQQPMQISMTSGACGACTFEIAVGDETQKNLVQVDENGNLLRDDNGYVLCGREDLQQPQTPQERQNDTQNYEVWIALRKDDTTYPELMPNGALKPTVNDTFVILGIRLPQGYITAAEQRLTDSLIKYMWENNKEKFTFSIKFSRIYFEENPDVLALLNENARLVIEYNNQQHTLYVEDFSYKMESDSPLPEITVTLADTLAVGRNSLQTQLDSVKQDILSSVGGGDFLRQGLKYFIRKDISDYAKGLITFRKGAVFGNNGFAQGLAGFGGKIDEFGNGELESLVLRRFLEVPEFRYNRVEVFVGDKWRGPGAGIIESVEITSDNTGIITLHLEDGEIGAVAVDDICMGIFHDYETPGNNSADDYDDGYGNRRFAGFCTVYFRITEILDMGNNGRFRYSLRSVDDGWNRQFHPLSAMHFVTYGNFTNVNRQCSVYETRTYTRMLVKQNTWEIGSVNVAMQWGDLSNLNVFGLEMSGYSAYLNNIYMSGTIDQTVNDPYRIEVSLSSVGQFVNYGETVTVKCKVFQGWTDKTAGVASWEITRDSGDTASDATWNASSKAQSFANTGEITLAYTEAVNDMGGNFATDGTLFNMSATLQDGTSVSTQLLLRAYPAASGVTRYWLVVEPNSINIDEIGGDNVDIIASMMEQLGQNEPTLSDSGVFAAMNLIMDGMAMPPILRDASVANPAVFSISKSNMEKISKMNIGLYKGTNIDNGTLLDYVDITLTRNGTDGEDAVTYDLIPSVGQINKSELTSSADDRIILEAYKITGSNRSDNLFDLQGSTSPPTDYKAQYSIDDGNWTDCGVTYNGYTYLYGVNYVIVNQVVSSLGLRLCDSDGNVLKTIPALKTVSDGVGSVSYWITADPEVVVFSPDAPSLTEVIPVTLTCWKQVGSDDPSVFTKGVLKVVYDSGTENELTLSGNSYSFQFSMLGGMLTIRRATATLYVDDVPVASKVVSVDETAPESSLLLRMSEWVSGVEYHDDTNLLYSTSGQKWLDIAVITKSATSFDAYRCKQTHTASISNKPGSGANWQTYWEKFNEMAPIYTPLIMAQNALLRFTQTNQLLVMKSDGTTVAAGLGGGNYPIWVGSPNADNAPFKVDINGKLYSTNAEITGTVIADGGRFLGGFGNPYTDFDLQGMVKFPSLQELIDGRNIRVVGSTANDAGIMLPVNIGTESRYDGVEFIIRNDTDDFLLSHPGNLVPRIRINGQMMPSLRLKQNTSVRLKIFIDSSVSSGGLCYEVMNPSDFYIMPAGILENGEVRNFAVSKNTKYYPANQSLQVVFNAWNAGNNAQATFYADSNYNEIDKWGQFYLSKSVWYDTYNATYNTNIPCHDYWFGLEDGKMRELSGFDIKFVNIQYNGVLSFHAQPKIVLQMYRGQRLFLMVSNPSSNVGGLVMEGSNTDNSISVKPGKLYEFVYYNTLYCLNPD